MKLFATDSNTGNSPARCSFFARVIVLLIGTLGFCHSIDADEGTEFFEEKIGPVLVDNCYKCHSDEADEPAGGLFLHTSEGIREGGELGPAVVPEDIDESLLISALEYRDLEMPPDGQLDESIIADFRKWIEMGAPDPRTDDKDELPQPIAKKNSSADPPVMPRLDRKRGYRFERDEKQQVIAVEYWGTTGLRALELHKLVNLKSVHIAAFTTLSSDDVAYLSKLHRVVELRLGNHLSDESVKIEGDLSQLGEMKSLQSLFVCKHKVINKDLEFIAQLPNLTDLEFNADTNPYHEDGPYVTDDCARHLTKAKKIKRLRISFGDFTDQFVTDVSKNLPELEHLDLQSSRLTDESLRSLVLNCPKLKSLSLNSDSLTAECLLYLAGNNRLRSLSLNVATVTNKGIRILTELPQLETAGLQSTKLTSKQLGVFRNHPRLRSLSFDGSELSLDEVLNIARTMPKLNYLNVGAHNKHLQSAVDELLKNRETE